MMTTHLTTTNQHSEQALIRHCERVWRKHNPNQNPNRPVQELPDAPY